MIIIKNLYHKHSIFQWYYKLKDEILYVIKSHLLFFIDDESHEKL